VNLDVEKVYSKFRDIDDSVKRLRAFRDLSLEAFLGDQDKKDVASFRLIVATEAAIDLCLHASARILRKVAEEYAACFKLLADEGLIDQGLASRLSDMARLRNLLVHRYWEIDYRKLYQIVTGPDLRDLEEFLRLVRNLMEQKT